MGNGKWEIHLAVFITDKMLIKLLTSFHCLSVIRIVSVGENPKTVVTELGTSEYRVFEMRFPTMWYFDMCRLRRASAASF